MSSELYENMHKWVLSLDDTEIVGITMDSKNCIVAKFTGKPVSRLQDLPGDVCELTDRFDHLGRTVSRTGREYLDEVEVTAKQARELFNVKYLDSSEKTC